MNSIKIFFTALALITFGLANQSFGTDNDTLQQGVIVKVFTVEGSTVRTLSDVNGTSLVKTMLSKQAGLATWNHTIDFIPANITSYVEISGYIKIKKTASYVFKLQNSDGAEFWLDNKLVISNDGLHDFSDKDGEVYLQEGYRKFLIKSFMAKGRIEREVSLALYSPVNEAFDWVPNDMLFCPRKLAQNLPVVSSEGMEKVDESDTTFATQLHPSYKLYDLVTEKGFEPKVGGIDFLPSGKMVVSSWDEKGSIYLIDGVVGENPKPIVKRIAWGLAEPLGVKVVDGKIYILQKQELTQLVDLDGDEVIDEYRTICNAWGATGNFHEFAFGLVYKDGFFYAALATAIQPGGKSTIPQQKDRGKFVKIGLDGTFEIIASGLRTPNGVGIGVDGEIFVADNQGDWLPACKILHMKKDAFYGSYSVDLYGINSKVETPPVVWLPQGEIGNSASQPAILNDGVYTGQMIHGDVTHGGLKRVFVEKVRGEYQGIVFPFSQGFAAGVNRICWGPDGALYVGGIGSSGNWSQYQKQWYGLQKIKHNGKLTFEMLAVRAKANGLEIEFTEPIGQKYGNDVSFYEIQQWQYVPTMNYGGPKIDLENLTIESVSFSSDRKKVFLEIPTIKERRVQAISIVKPVYSKTNRSIWANIGWYTMNALPTEKGVVTAAKPKLTVAKPQPTTPAKPQVQADNYKKLTPAEEQVEILAGARLVKPSGCNTCHAMDQKILGPSFRMIAQKYNNDPATLKKLTEKVYNGGSGVWGDYAMGAQSHIKKEKITQMVRYILSLK